MSSWFSLSEKTTATAESSPCLAYSLSFRIGVADGRRVFLIPPAASPRNSSIVIRSGDVPGLVDGLNSCLDRLLRFGRGAPCSLDRALETASPFPAVSGEATGFRPLRPHHPVSNTKYRERNPYPPARCPRSCARSCARTIVGFATLPTGQLSLVRVPICLGSRI